MWREEGRSRHTQVVDCSCTLCCPKSKLSLLRHRDSREWSAWMCTWGPEAEAAVTRDPAVTELLPGANLGGTLGSSEDHSERM